MIFSKTVQLLGEFQKNEKRVSTNFFGQELGPSELVRFVRNAQRLRRSIADPPLGQISYVWRSK